MKKLTTLSLFLGFIFTVAAADTNSAAWLTRPLSLADALNTALTQNATILKAQNDLEASHGLVVQTRAVALPQVTASGKYEDEELTLMQNFPGALAACRTKTGMPAFRLSRPFTRAANCAPPSRPPTPPSSRPSRSFRPPWRTRCSPCGWHITTRCSRRQQITVHEASVNLLQKELEDQQHRLDAGTVPKFNVLRAEVAVANERPNLIRAKNQYRIAKNNLANLLGYNLPRDIWENIPLNLTDALEAAPYDVNLPDAIQQALTRRTELVALRKQVELQQLNIINAKSGYKPTVSVFAGYNWMNNEFTTELDNNLNGWNAGAQMSWNIFDGAADARQSDSGQFAICPRQDRSRRPVAPN